MFFLSPRGTSPPKIASTALFTGTLSPVRAASSILRDALSRSLPSAGTASPASSITTSPGTSWLLSMTICFPSLITLHFAAVIV